MILVILDCSVFCCFCGELAVGLAVVSGLTLVSSPLLSSGHGRSQPGSGSFILSLHPRLRQQPLCRHSARKSRECAVQVRGSPAERLTPAVSTSTPTPESPLTHLYLMLAGKLAAVDANSPIKPRRTGIYADINDVFSILLSSPKATRSINVSERLRRAYRTSWRRQTAGWYLHFATLPVGIPAAPRASVDTKGACKPT